MRVARIDRRPDEHEPLEALGLARGQIHGDLAAERIGDHERLLDPLGVEPCAECVGEAADPERVRRAVAEPGAGEVDGEDTLLRDEQPPEWDEVAARDADPVHEDDRPRALGSTDAAVHPQRADLRPAALELAHRG